MRLKRLMSGDAFRLKHAQIQLSTLDLDRSARRWGAGAADARRGWSAHRAANVLHSLLRKATKHLEVSRVSQMEFVETDE
ncbi:hypothetical protein EVAR_68352_1 [Eumeta japonica]|uniref:Uncharacterized protein n=1 Tax=Eumeta variegata TaxID=151549 RepID=A0A4C1SLD1_EUMVA|nr:hypothetical protein EVAR_68352_1 [Eumeta japonica]